jgi:hypothetical protein
MSINLENIEEELDEIEYLEILTIDEIIKDNPSFIALSRDEINNNLYELLKNKSKSESVTQLLYDINNRQGKSKDYTNYIFQIDASKKDYSDIDKEKDSQDFNNMKKLSSNRYNQLKNKYFFAIKYNDDSTYMRLKPCNKLNTSLISNNKDYPLIYPVFPIDDVNIPIIASYYNVPASTINDYIYVKITSHLFNNQNINLKQSRDFTSVDNLVKYTRPEISTIIENLHNSFELDYNNINNIFKRFDYSLDLITYDDFGKLCDYMISITKNHKEREDVYRKIKIKIPSLINNKSTYFNKINTTLKLLRQTDKAKNIMQNLKEALEKQKFDNIDNDELPDMQTFNISEVLNDINDGNITLEKVIENIKKMNNKNKIDTSLKFINRLTETNENLKDILEEYEVAKSNFDYARYHVLDYDKDGKDFATYYSELKEIIQGGNEDNYEGIPLILKNSDFEAFEDLNYDMEMQEQELVINNNTLERYWLNLRYKNENGFIELLKIILPIINEIQKKSNIPIDYDLLCSELFNHYRSVSTKYNLLKQNFDQKSLEINANVINDIAKLSPFFSIYVDLNMSNDIKKIIIEVNQTYSKTLNEAFASAIAWWSLYVQQKILNNSIIINDNDLNPMYIDKWFSYGVPLQNNEKTGILIYICQVITDFFKEKNDYLISENICKEVINIIEERYKILINELRMNYIHLKEKRKIEQGVIAQKIMIENVNSKKFDNISNDYVNALLYMPGVNYRKIHKFILGCCLQKINKDFKPDNDLVSNGRKDLIDIKSKFAKRKETNKKRYIRFSPIGKQTIMEEEKDNVKFLKIEQFSYNIKNNEKIVDDWLNKMYGKNPLLTDNIIDEIKSNSRNLIEHIEKNIKLLQTTSRNKKSDLEKLFTIGKINSRDLLLSINKILNSYMEYDNENVKTLINLSIVSVKGILYDLYKLNKISNDDIKIDVDRINAYIVSRAMCLPCNPELNNDMYMIPVMDIPQVFIEENAKKIHNKVLNALKFSKFPTMQENIDFLNKKREENKQMKLNILNNKSVEENQLISNLKKAGIKHDLMNLGNEDNVIIENAIEEYIFKEEQDGDVSRGENDFILKQEDDEMDDDKMDDDNMGFIYSR